MLSGLCGWGVICTFDPWHFNFNCFGHSRSSLLHYSKAVCLCRHHEERRQRSHFICYLLSVTTTYLPQIPTPYGRKLRLRQTVCVCVCKCVHARVRVCVSVHVQVRDCVCVSACWFVPLEWKSHQNGGLLSQRSLTGTLIMHHRVEKGECVQWPTAYWKRSVHAINEIAMEVNYAQLKVNWIE